MFKNTYKSYTILRAGHFDRNNVMTFFHFFSKYSPFAVMHFSCLLTHLTYIWEKQFSERVPKTVWTARLKSV